jgi:arylsulfatase
MIYMDNKLKKKVFLSVSVLGFSVGNLFSTVSPALAATDISHVKQDNKKDLQSNEIKQDAKQKTNVLYIVLDDMGFSDFGCYGSEIKTPNIDKLAANGLSYNNFTVCPVCSPTRASLLTGRDSHAVGMGQVSRVDLGVTVPDTRGRITDKAATVAQILKTNGFSTLGVGKWHVAPLHQVTPAGPFDNWPLAKGFERYYGFLDGEADQYDPQLIYDNHQIDSPKKNGYQLSADLVNMSEQLVTDSISVAPQKPFFLYLAFGAVHAPIQVSEEYIDMYKGVYDKGWDKIRQERFERQKKLGIIPASAELAPRDAAVKPWETLSSEEKQVFVRFQQAYAGYLTYADAQIGRMTEYLKSIGQFDNTMIVVISDNGAAGMGGDEGGDYLIAGLAAKHKQSYVKDYFKKITEIGGPEVEAIYQRGWAMASNTPFKGYKESVYAGGTRVPLIIHWPEGIKAKGEVRNQAVDVTDITPTVLDILNIKAPTIFQGIDQLPMHGTSITNTFDNAEASSKHNVQYNLLHTRASLEHGGGNRSITKDGWKAVNSRKDALDKNKVKWELYNLNEDFSETHDMADQYPDKLNELKDLWEKEALGHGAVLTGKPGPTDAPNKRNTFKYLPDTGYLGKAAVPMIANKSYTITVPIEREKKSQEGILVAHGDHFAGYALYVQNNRLVYEFNDYGQVTRIVSNEEIPTGSAVVQFKFSKSGADIAGIGQLFINEKMVGEAPISRVHNLISSEGLSVGRDMYSPVSPHYKKKGEFAFNGKYEYVLYEIQNNKKDSKNSGINTDKKK